MTDSPVPPPASQQPPQPQYGGQPQYGQPQHSQHPLLDKVQGFTKEVFDRSAQVSFGIGAISLVLAIVLFAWPGATLTVVGYIFATYLVLSGIVQVVATFGGPLQPSSGWWRFLSFISGALSIMLAVVAFRNVAESLVILAIFIGVGWLFRGVAGLAFALDLPKGVSGKTWGVIMAGLSIVAGIIVVVYPADSVGALALVSGILLAVLGIVEIFHGFQIRSTYNRVVPQV